MAMYRYQPEYSGGEEDMDASSDAQEGLDYGRHYYPPGNLYSLRRTNSAEGGEDGFIHTVKEFQYLAKQSKKTFEDVQEAFTNVQDTAGVFQKLGRSAWNMFREVTSAPEDSEVRRRRLNQARVRDYHTFYSGPGNPGPTAVKTGLLTYFFPPENEYQKRHCARKRAPDISPRSKRIRSPCTPSPRRSQPEIKRRRIGNYSSRQSPRSSFQVRPKNRPLNRNARRLPSSHSRSRASRSPANTRRSRDMSRNRVSRDRSYSRDRTYGTSRDRTYRSPDRTYGSQDRKSRDRASTNISPYATGNKQQTRGNHPRRQSPPLSILKTPTEPTTTGDGDSWTSIRKSPSPLSDNFTPVPPILKMPSHQKEVIAKRSSSKTRAAPQRLKTQPPKKKTSVTNTSGRGKSLLHSLGKGKTSSRGSRVGLNNSIKSKTLVKKASKESRVRSPLPLLRRRSLTPKSRSINHQQPRPLRQSRSRSRSPVVRVAVPPRRCSTSPQRASNNLMQLGKKDHRSRSRSPMVGASKMSTAIKSAIRSKSPSNNNKAKSPLVKCPPPLPRPNIAPRNIRSAGPPLPLPLPHAAGPRPNLSMWNRNQQPIRPGGFPPRPINAPGFGAWQNSRQPGPRPNLANPLPRPTLPTNNALRWNQQPLILPVKVAKKTDE